MRELAKIHVEDGARLCEIDVSLRAKHKGKLAGRPKGPSGDQPRMRARWCERGCMKDWITEEEGDGERLCV